MTDKLLFALAMLIAVAVLQVLLVHLGHPHAVWLWCAMLGLC